MESAPELSKPAFQAILWAANILALLPMLAGTGLAQSESPKPPAVNEETSHVRLVLAGWSEEVPGDGLRYWRDAEGDVLSLGVVPKKQAYPFTSSEAEQRKWCRSAAENRNAGLIEVRTMPSTTEPSASFIYKKLQMPAYRYIGQLVTRVHGASVVWTVVAEEHGTTGVREAVVTANLMSRGKLTLDGYEQSWAQDPYDPAYHGVDRSVLRFMSDDESYDAQFPKHPLSRVRRVLASLPDAVEYDFGTDRKKVN